MMAGVSVALRECHKCALFVRFNPPALVGRLGLCVDCSLRCVLCLLFAYRVAVVFV
jgi:hypothetical protein